MIFQNVADFVDPEDPAGRTFRQINLTRAHAIPIGTLVEILPYEDSSRDGVRMFVAFHARDCDGTPLYSLSPSSEDLVAHDSRFGNRGWIGGFGEETLKVIRRPE
jgi:hypothetical protein